MSDPLLELMGAVAGRADYADARRVHSATEQISTRNGSVERVERVEHAGVGVRVRVGGAWGFAATRETEGAAIAGALSRALEVASAQPQVASNGLPAEPPARGEWSSAAAIDPFAVPLEDKLALLNEADQSMRGDDRIALTQAHFLAQRDVTTFSSTDGALCSQTKTECGGGIAALAVDGEESQLRSYPGSFRGDVAQAGYEHFSSLELAAHGPRVADEAVALTRAPRCPSGRTTLVLDGEQLALQLHESVGHAVELDRILGSEASYAGTSFLSPTDLGSLRYGSDLMNVTADATSPGGLGTCAWDDEGVAAQATPIVREGILRGFLSSRESSAEAGLGRSGGCMRAEGFDRQPLVRMTNVNLEPGDAGSLDDLVQATERGIYMETNRSWSIDSRRLQFQFATEAAWEIVDGRRGRLLRNPSYGGLTPDFWAGLDAICSPSDWRLWGIVNCGKGEPGQVAHVSHGTAPARFLDVEVGVA